MKGVCVKVMVERVKVMKERGGETEREREGERDLDGEQTTEKHGSTDKLLLLVPKRWTICRGTWVK